MTGYPGTPASLQAALPMPIFTLNLSKTLWACQSSVKNLMLDITCNQADEDLRKEYKFQMMSKEQLAAWKAELMQASNYTCKSFVS